MNNGVKLILVSALGFSVLTACSPQSTMTKTELGNEKVLAAEKGEIEVIAPHKDLDQKPIPIKIERVGPTEVNVEMTAQITDIEIDKGKIYKAWTLMEKHQVH